MKRTTLRVLVVIQFLLAANAGLLCAQSNFSTEGVTCRTNRTLLQRGSEWTLLKAEMTMPGGIEVFTNGTFRVNKGKARQLQEGQFLRPDGNLLNPDGSIMPVFDHIAMSGLRVMVFKDGEGEALTDTLVLPDGTGINPDGTYVRPSGRRSRLVDGQLLTLEGVPMGGLDTIRFSNGKVVVYKSGALIPLRSPNVIMGMYDGTRVRGDGYQLPRWHYHPNGRGTDHHLGRGACWLVGCRRLQRRLLSSSLVQSANQMNSKNVSSGSRS